jgi:hypothetical protein
VTTRLGWLLAGLALAGSAAQGAEAGGQAAGQAPADAAAPGAEMTYGVYVGGVHVVDAVASLALAENRYRVRLQAAMQGFLGTLAPITADTVAEGRLADGSVRPARYRSVATWRNRPRLTELRYGGDAVEVITDPPPEQEREPVPEALRRDTVDPLTAAVGMIETLARGGRCDGRVPVFDGRQRYDLDFAAAGEEELAPSDVGLFRGRAQVCTVTFRPLAGRWKAARRDRDEGAPPRRGAPAVPMTLWLARLTPGDAPVPVRLAAETPFGTVLVHLARYSREASLPPPTRLAGPAPPEAR